MRTVCRRRGSLLVGPRTRAPTLGCRQTHGKCQREACIKEEQSRHQANAEVDQAGDRLNRDHLFSRQSARIGNFFHVAGENKVPEITDAAMAERAECVMLNKGPYMVDAVKMLDDVLRRMQHHQTKKFSLLRPLNIAEKFVR